MPCRVLVDVLCFNVARTGPFYWSPPSALFRDPYCRDIIYPLKNGAVFPRTVSVEITNYRLRPLRCFSSDSIFWMDKVGGRDLMIHKEELWALSCSCQSCSLGRRGFAYVPSSLIKASWDGTPLSLG
ncbi:hypothetical protein J6590_094401 [Homalodisca vitripennis]|nr:hypothetical protein J6590_094401 [Homalodisca vitripennis]